MNILIDLSNIQTGGAIQNSLAFLRYLKDSTYNHWKIIASGPLADEIPKKWGLDLPNIFFLRESKNLRGLYNTKKYMEKIDKEIAPELVFTLCGPPYWRAKKIHMCGFAKPQILYPKLNKIVNSRMKTFEVILKELKLHFQKKQFKKIDYLIGQTKIVKKRACDKLGYPISNFKIIENSFSKVFSEALEEQKKHIVKEKQIRNQIFIPAFPYVHKNLELIPHIAKYIKKIDEKNVFIFCIDKNSTQWKQIKILGDKLDVASMLMSVGKILHKDLAKQYLISDIILLPTLLECSSATYPEAMIAGKPIITTDFDFSRALCGDAALYFDYDDPKSAAEKITLLLENQSLRKKIISEGKEQLKSKFPSPRQKFKFQLKLILDIYNEHYQTYKR
tara:strand:+ start:10615 stop:11784 length:1170 start_codon:yes stop_codon:yes gene_type:complete